MIDLIGRAQQQDGYVDTYFIVKEPENRFRNFRDCHELYCCGHLTEAAVAYYRATGKPRLLEIAKRFIDCISSRVGTEEGKLPAYPGHEELELALIKLLRSREIQSINSLHLISLKSVVRLPIF